jgi:hypothetical protein
MQRRSPEGRSKATNGGSNPPYFTIDGWASRRWILRFDELSYYLATKDNAKLTFSLVRERPDLAIVKAWIKRRAQDEHKPKGRNILDKVREDKAKLLLSQARAFLERRSKAQGGA